MATLKDISRHLGLSITQVSRALNGHSDVNAETRKRVERVAKQLKYSPNVTARKLVSGRSGMVGLVYPSYSHITADNSFLETITGLSLEFSSRGMQFVLHVTPADEDLIGPYERLISGGSLDGFVLVEPLTEDVRIDYLKQRNVPFVVHGRANSAPDYPYFDIDNYDVAFRLTSYLAARGHRNIALINGQIGRTYAIDRLRGFTDALKAAGLPYHAHLVAHGRMTDSLGMLSTVQMFTGSGIKPTAIISSNILIANGIYKALQALDLSIPRDVSVVAHDDVLLQLRASAFYPPLTVTRSALKNSWAPLANFLTGAVDGLPVEQLQEVANAEFIERGSVADAPDTST